MRLWSIHPSYLDSKGLVALWREALLAKKVLEGKTRGYRNHPQLNRFKEHKSPSIAINNYLNHVWKEANIRGYSFDKKKIACNKIVEKIIVTADQIKYEFLHLSKKLKQRDKAKYKIISKLKKIKPNPIFKIKKGKIESWERVDN